MFKKGTEDVRNIGKMLYNINKLNKFKLIINNYEKNFRFCSCSFVCR